MVEDTRIFDDLSVAVAGLALRGAFHPTPDDGVPNLPDGRPTGTLVLLGWTAPEHWDAFVAAPEAGDGAPHPLDRWSRRVVGALVDATGAEGALFPFAGPPFHPFQRWAMRAEPVHPSPLGLLVHPEFGLWHSWRGALLFAQRLALPKPDARKSPCATCLARPCLTACPVGAFSPEGYDVAACAAHVASPEGQPCREGGCLARRACLVAPDRAYGAAQTAFHWRAFLAARAETGVRSAPAP